MITPKWNPFLRREGTHFIQTFLHHYNPPSGLHAPTPVAL